MRIFAIIMEGLRHKPVRPSPSRTPLLIAALATAAVQTLAIFDTSLWVQPDSVGYVQLGLWLSRYHDFSHELFLNRTPGYPLFLAGVFTLAGPASAWVIQGMQHGAVVAVAVLTSRIAWELTHGRVTAALAGIMAGSGWSLTAYASTVLTEPLYTLVLIAGTCAFVCHLRSASISLLAAGSALFGVAAWIRPIGMPLLAFCLVLGVWRATQQLRRRRTWRLKNPGSSSLGSNPQSAIRNPQWAAAPLLAAVLPAALLMGSWSLHTRAVHGVSGVAGFGGQSLFHRVVFSDGWVEPANPELDDIKRCIAQFNLAHPGAAFDFRKYEHACLALRGAHGCTETEAGAIMGRAAWQLARAHPWETARGTMFNAARILLVADPVYLQRLDEAETGLISAAAGAGDASASAQTATSMAGYYRDFRMRIGDDPTAFTFVPSPQPRALFSISSTAEEWVDRYVVRARGLPFLPGDAPYEQWVYFCAAGLLVGVLQRRRAGWLIVAGVMLAQVMPSAFMPGATPRFAVPVRPLLDLAGAAWAASLVAVVPWRWIVMCFIGAPQAPPATQTSRPPLPVVTRGHIGRRFNPSPYQGKGLG